MKIKNLSTLLVLIASVGLAYFFVPIASAENNNLIFAMGVGLGGLVCFFAIAVQEHRQKNSTSTISLPKDTLTLYLGNLSYKANERDIKRHFSSVGEVISVRLMKDKHTGKRKGFGFVEMFSNHAQLAMKELNNTEFMDRTLKVRMAKDKTNN
jgi:hypothetical protein